jgi:hypothetical protein
MENIIDLLAKPQVVAITAYVAMIIGVINIALTLKNELQKLPILKIDFPRNDLSCFHESDSKVVKNGFLITFIKLTNKSALPLHISSFDLHCDEIKTTFDSLSPLYNVFQLNQLERITIGPETNILRPNIKIEPYSSIQGFIYFEGLAVSNGQFELFINTPKKVFKTTISAQNVT